MLPPNKTPSSWRKAIAAFTTLAILSAAAVMALTLHMPPAALPASAPAAVFSAGRAISHVHAIARMRHPSWSPAAGDVREYILNQLRALGLDPQVQHTTTVRDSGGYYGAGIVNNIVTRLGGSANTRAVMLAAHYDSVPTGPGASDDGSGVATLLETVRALKYQPALKNDLIILVTDGEEEDLYGAHAFVTEHPWAKDVGLALNFEARGAGGPSFMFETSDQNGWLIDEFCKAAPFPTANSLTYALYKTLPNDTDMTEFKAAGMAGLNFAFIGQWNRYHTMLDTPENLDRRSLQQEGSDALALTLAFANLDLSNAAGARKPDAIYFNTIGCSMVHYPAAAATPLAIATLVLFIAVGSLAFKRGAMTLRRFAIAILAVPVALALAWILGSGSWLLIKAIAPSYNHVPWGDPYNGLVLLAAVSALTLAVSALIYVWCARKIGLVNLALGAAFWWLLATMASAVLLPGAGFLFEWPLVFVLLGIGLISANPGRSRSLGFAVVLCLTAVPAIVLSTPLIYDVYLLTGLNAPGLLASLVALVAALLVPQLSSMPDRARPAVYASLALGLVAVGIVLVEAAAWHPDSNHRLIDDVFYAADQDNGSSEWLSLQRRPDDFTGQMLKGQAQRESLEGFFPWITRPEYGDPAPAADFAPPVARLVEERLENGHRHLSINLASPRGSPALVVALPPASKVVAASVNGKPCPPLGADLKRAPKRWVLLFTSVPTEGFNLAVDTAGKDKIRLRVVDVSFGLPALNGIPIKPRPDYLMAAPYGGVSDTTVVGKSFEF